ncbi:MAG: carboxypeptidase regulatory-like domain-containing protein [Acidobacteriales bacterium]|nr:carboxypeptidase regulatory-like domain-containing protein [Terriglobales bacterium]
MFALMATGAFGQSQITTGAMQGTVTDSSGAVVAGATVDILNLDNNLTKSLTTDSDGRYVALLLQPGRYKVTAKRSGFGTTVRDGVELTVGQTLNLPFSLKAAGGTETVVVTGTPDVDPTKTESSSTLNDRTISTTPVLGRKFEDLLTLTPGVSVTQGPDGDEINFNGQRGIFNNISLDGGDYQNGFFGEQAGGQRAAVDIPIDAIKEFQVIASGSSAEFGRTASGVVNVITKSGTNAFHGSIFHYQRHEALSSNTSTGEPLTGFHREQWGTTLGGPIRKDKAFFFLSYEGIAANLQRANLSAQQGPTACPVAAPTVQLNEALINTNADCQRLALLNFYQTTFGQNEGLPIRRPKHVTAVIGKLDFNVNPSNQLAVSYNFTATRAVNETFDVPTYGSSANGTEGTGYINGIRVNLNSSLRSNLLNELRFAYTREGRPRQASPSSVAADAAIGPFGVLPFRFGNPFFLQPNVDETFWRTQISDSISWVKGKHTVKFGGEWLHSVNSQVFRGFFSGRYIFGSVVNPATAVSGFLRYASPAAPGGFGPGTGQCADGTYVTAPTACADASFPLTPLLLYLQGANGDLSPATDAAGASDISNENIALFIQDKWQIHPRFTLNLGFRWEAQTFPDPVTPPSQTVYGPFLNDPTFPSDGTLPSQWKQFQPRLGFAWDIMGNAKSTLRASWGIYNAQQNMLSQVGSITANGVQQATIAGGLFANPTVLPTFPGTFVAAPLPPGTFPSFSGIRIFDRNYHNPRIYVTNVAYEQQLANSLVAYADFTWSKGVFLTNFLNYGRADRIPFFPFFGATYPVNVPFQQLGETMVTSSRANSLYRGITFGVRKSYSHNFQMDMNYTYARDYDNDSNERDPFTDRSGPASATDPFPLRNDYSPSDRDIRHKFNFVITGDLPWGFKGNMRTQARSAQPQTFITRNDGRKDNVYASVDWRLSRPIKFGERYALIPTFEMFNTFNADNNIIPEPSDPLFNFQGFVRQGVGDPRQVQLSIKFTF